MIKGMIGLIFVCLFVFFCFLFFVCLFGGWAFFDHHILGLIFNWKQDSMKAN